MMHGKPNTILPDESELAVTLNENGQTNAAAALVPDQQAAEQFFKALAIDLSDVIFEFRTLDDNHDRDNGKLTDTLTGTIQKKFSTLAKKSHSGVGCFFVVNKTDGKGVKAENVTEVRAIFVDLDGAPLSKILQDKEFPPPHIINESSPGKYHAYWKITGLALEQFRAMQKMLIRRYNGDPSVHDLPRLMRIPGLIHQKIKNGFVVTPSVSRIFKINDAPAYSPDDFLPFVTDEDQKESVELYTAATTLRPDAELEADPDLVAEAVRFIPNEDLEWGAWNRILMAIWRATRGNKQGSEIADTWSKKSTKYNYKRTAERWNKFAKSPAHRIGAGTLFMMASEVNPNWRADFEDQQQREVYALMAARLAKNVEQETVYTEKSDVHNSTPEPDDDDTDNVSISQRLAPALSEISLADLFCLAHGENLRYVHKWGQWLRWDGTRWKEETTLLAYDCAREICREAANRCNKSSQKKAIASAKTVAAVERIARADRVISAEIERFDMQRYKLNTDSGTVDLKTGVISAPRRKDYLTQKAGCTVAPPGTPHPIWSGFLKRITADNKYLIRFLQRFVGYCLSGDISEHVFIFGYGTGANGKGTFINTIKKILGDYATVADINLFLENRNEQHPTNIAKLRGARLVIAQEIQEGRSWNEQVIKNVTGGDPLTARFMRQDFFDFDPTFKLFIAANHKPRLKNVDEAIRRRMLLMPFTIQIPKKERDLKLMEKLEAEWPAILRWALDGYAEWQRIGLAPPAIITEATDKYFENEDSLGQWIEDACNIDIGNKIRWEKFSELFGEWTEYAVKIGDKPGTAKAFSEALTNRGFIAFREGHSQARAFYGVSLKLEVADWDNVGKPRD
jgi:putative DNA primase/helicase